MNKKIKKIIKNLTPAVILNMYHVLRLSYSNLRMDKLKKTIEKNYFEVINNFKPSLIENDGINPYNIWVCWLQGEENMPDVVKLCYASLKKNARAGCNVNLITEKNLQEYIQLPEYIITKYKDKSISPPHFSDIIRVSLLHQHGGLWLDATVLVTNVLPESFGYSLFSVKSKIDSHANIALNRWAVFLFYANKGNPLFEFLETFFKEYLVREKKFVHYFLLDIIIAIAYDKIPTIREMLENIPFNNPRIHDLKSQINNVYNSEQYDEIMLNTMFHKLSYKINIKEMTDTGELTFYGYIKRQLLIAMPTN
jgi:hypothetical protein